MNIYCVSFAAALLASSSATHAQDDQMPRGPRPDWAKVSLPLDVPVEADGALFLRKQDTIVHLNEEGQYFYQSQMIRILHPQALQAGNVSVTWNPAAGKPMVHALRVHRDGEIIDVLETTDFEILRREDQLETAMLDGMLTAVLRVPDLRVGDDLEFEFTVPSHDPTLGQDSFGVLFLAHSPPKGRVRLGLTWTDMQEPRTKFTPDFADKVTRGENSLEMLFDNPESVTAPKDAPPRYSWMRILEYSDFASWNDVSTQFSNLFDEASALETGSAIRAEAERIRNKHTNKLERAVAALELVQQQVRYIYVGLNGGNFTPATAEETWSRRYGDCKGKTVLLMALLREMGIDAEAVLANNSGGDDGLDQRLANPAMFDHVLVRATIDGKQYWMDGTLPDIIGPREVSFMPYRWVLPLSRKGASLEQVPFQTPKLPLEMGIVEIDARGGFDKPARQQQTIVKRGLDGLAEYMQFSALSSEQFGRAFKDALIGSGKWYDVEDVKYKYDRDTDASIITISGTAPVDWSDDGDGTYDLTLPGGGFSPPSRRQRPTDQDQSAPYYSRPGFSCHVTTVRLPESTGADNWGFNSTFDTMLFGRAYYRMMEKRDDGTIRMVRGSKVIDHEIDAKRASRDNGRVSDFDNSTARIYYDPDRTFNSWGNLRSVPATFEQDWTADATACLPPDLANND